MAQDVCFVGYELDRQCEHDMRTRIAAVRTIETKRNSVDLVKLKRADVMAGEAYGIDATSDWGAAYQPIVTKTTIERVIALPPVKRIVTLVTDKSVRAI